MQIFDNITMDFSRGHILILKDGRLQVFDLKKWLVDTAPALKATDSKAGISLDVLTSASGILINGRVYPGKEWKRCAKDFAGKPVLKHHDMYQDAIGRISKGWFEQLATGDAFDNDWKDPSIQGKGEPTGLVWTECNITDPDAIQKISDERLLHVSQGSNIEKACCSICQRDWAAGDYCEHRMGEMNEVNEGKKAVKKLAFFQTWGLTPMEVSAVNSPAFKQAAFQVPKDATDSVREVWTRVNDSVQDSTARGLGAGTSRLVIRDAAGQETQLLLQPRETIEVLAAPSNPSKNTPDTPDVLNSGSESDMELKDAMNKISELESAKAADAKLMGELRAAKDAAESGKAKAEADLKDARNTLKTLQEAHDKILSEQHSMVVDTYIKEAGVPEASREETKKKLAGIDVSAIRLMIDEAIRIRKEVKTAAAVQEPIKPATEGAQGGTVDDKKGPTNSKARKTRSPLLQ